MDVVITGSHGLIGTALAARLRSEGHRPIAMVRGPASGDQISWDPSNGTLDRSSLEGVDAVVHLAGAGIADHRWTDDYKRSISESRAKGTALLGESLAALQRRPAVLVSGSAIGYYGDRGEEELDERSTAGTGFLSEVCVRWEQAAGMAVEAGIRTAFARTGIVLSAKGGALRKQLPLFKVGLGGRLGSGRQWQSWISLDDEVGAIVHLLTHDVAGPVNLTAPSPVTNREFTRALGAQLHRPTALPIPSFGPKLLLGSELAASLLFEGQKVIPRVLQESGYQFQYASLQDCLRHELGGAA